MPEISSLARSALFSGLGEDALARIAGQFRHQSVKAGERIFDEGDLGSTYYVIATGEAVVLKGSGVARWELGRLGPGDGFGEMALLADEPRSASVNAATDMDLLCLDREAFTALMEQEPTFAPRVLQLVSSRLRRVNQAAAADLLRAHQGLILSLAQLAESRDAATGAHLYRVRDYCTMLAGLLAEDPRFAGAVGPEFIETMYYVSPLHDIGKVGVPDSILCKRGSLTEEEYEVVKSHTVIGARALDTVLQFCDLDMFRMAREIVIGHHERYDGGGYPQGLRGDDIPLAARIMSIADYYDALRSKRAYKPALSHEEAVAGVRGGAGTQFDPAIAEIMVAHAERFDAVHRQYAEMEGT